MKLYGFPNSPHTWKVRALAAHLGVPLEHVYVDLLKGENKTPEFLALAPSSRLPVMVDGDLTLWESNAMLQYVASLKPTPLYPDDARLRAEITNWLCWHGHHWSRACEPLLFENIVKELYAIGLPDPKAVAAAEQTFAVEARVLDLHLMKRAYLVGGNLTIADLAVASYLFHTERGRLPVAPHEHVRRWFGTVSALPAWKETAPGPVTPRKA